MVTSLVGMHVFAILRNVLVKFERDRLRQIFFRTKTETAKKKFKAQRNKFNNLKKQAKQRFYDNINEHLDGYLPCRNARFCYIKKCFSKI
jgi:hypothetical protein